MNRALLFAAVEEIMNLKMCVFVLEMEVVK